MLKYRLKHISDRRTDGRADHTASLCAAGFVPMAVLLVALMI